ncbi:uncharacterized protein LOC111705948 isoform X2 [Eurytemora carolleeae]|uniref:uncharacterized protein LOC111705948 isoform X2 n=1 Tax=Eurytemora carolleeae TaxID=1294199 RepID=UPI000C7880B8|nr:uncharacterized protein LOC111705948 isoform X2 [Eurytemora carolleeae]|eukprot:XP_023334431.1 uncharacterized protein LOC111705948 isoform X2 [Eurytemora affinis]
MKHCFPSLKLPVQGVLCVVGGFLLFLSFASDFSYSNLNTYITSYARSSGYEENGEYIKYNPELTYADFVFVTTTKVLLQGFCMPFLGVVARKIGVRPSILVVVLTMAMHGIGFCFVYATAIGAAQKWFPRSMKGLVSSLVLSGYGFGSLIWIPVQTSFVNPDNIKATVDEKCTFNGTQESKCDKYFTDPEVLENIPNMFLLLGGVFGALGIIATILISEPNQSKEDQDEMSSIQDKTSTDQMTQTFSLTPIQVLRTRTFYQTWMGFFNITLTSGIISNYSKTFGLTFINDDHYFALIGVISNVFNGLCRIFWGFLYDRLGFRGCYMCLATIVTITTALFPFLPYLDADSMAAKGCYGTCMAVLFAAFPGIYPIIAPAINDGFGPDHYQANFGLMFTQSIAYAGFIFVLTKISVVYAFLGYSGMFVVAAVIGVLGLVTVFFLPKHLSSEAYRSKFS